MAEQADGAGDGGDVVGPGRVAVVTGGSSGIGRALVELLVAEGSAVVVADIDATEAEVVAASVRAEGGQALAVAVDVADAASVDALAAAVLDRFGHVDVVVNNAGVSTFNLLADQTLDDWRWVLDVDLWGVVHGVHTFLPILRDQGTPAHIVNTSSMGGLMGGLAFIGPYAAAKAAVVSISETLRQEVAFTAPHIGVSVLCPSTTDTRIMESERVRPTERGVEQRRPDAEGMRLAIKSMFADPASLTAAQVAARTVEAIRAGEFWVIPAAGERAVVDARTAEILGAFPDSA